MGDAARRNDLQISSSQGLTFFIEIPSIKPLDYEHPQDHLNRRAMASDSAGVGMASEQIGLHEVEQLVVIEQFVEAGEFGLELKLEFGDHLEEVHGIVTLLSC